MATKTLKCPDCGAPISPHDEYCPYCHQYLQGQPSARGEVGQEPSPGESSLGSNAVGARSPRPVFQRKMEPNEGAFTLSVPHGWLVEGGIMRANLMQGVIDAQSIEAKLDFTVKRDPAGSVLIRWCPEVKYCDMALSPAAMMGFFPPGSNYQGMLVCPVMTAQEFLIRTVFPWAHPQATQVQVVAQESLPLLVEGYRRRMAALGVPTNFSYDGGIVAFTYVENGVRLYEKAFAVIENMGHLAAGMWSNKDTILIRGPADEFDAWEPILHHIRESVQINFQWLAREITNQEMLSRSFLNAQQASMARDRRMLEIQQHIQELDRQIVEHRQRTNAEIQNDAYLNLMDLEEYVNPYTNEPELGSNQWDCRWVTEDGDEFYTDNPDDNPNIPSTLNRSDWKRTMVRPRRT
jgi:hypothetical protein